MKTEQKTGTLFALNHSGKQYLITAYHLVEGLKNLNAVKIFHDRQWKSLPLKLVGIAETADIAILASTLQLAPSGEMETTAGTGGIGLGQQVFFLGFPLMMTGGGENINRDFPIPLVKSGVLSGVEFGDPIRIWVDGHNTRGFSGGPLVFVPPSEQSGKGLNFKVAGVISGYRSSPRPVLNSGGDEIGSVHENSGILLAHDIKVAIELIDANPIGYVL